MTAITQNLPWFIVDLGTAIIGKVCSYLVCSDRPSSPSLGMLRLPGRELERGGRQVSEVFTL